MAKLMIYGRGYSRPYMTDAAEVGSATAGNWFPSSVDFQVTAMRSGMASGASSLVILPENPKVRGPSAACPMSPSNEIEPAAWRAMMLIISASTSPPSSLLAPSASVRSLRRRFRIR